MRLFVSVLLAAMVVLTACDPKPADEPAEAAAEHNAALVADLDASTEAIREMVANLSEDQWNFREAEDRWSIAEVLEHVAAAEDAVTAMIDTMVLASEPVPGGRADSAVTDEVISGTLADRSQQFQAPPEFVPTGRYGSPEETLAAFEAARARTRALLAESTELRQYVAPHPAFGPMDGEQWFLFVISHGKRHTDQIAQVKADENFPATA